MIRRKEEGRLFGGFEYRVLKVILSSCRTVEMYLTRINVLLRLYIEEVGGV